MRVHGDESIGPNNMVCDFCNQFSMFFDIRRKWMVPLVESGQKIESKVTYQFVEGHPALKD